MVQAHHPRPNGIFLVTGPTGSGKTTTLYAALAELNRPDVKIITAEDPVEYHLAGINQVQVHSRIGLTFARILRAMLRCAPNIILVGEIRDLETAEIAIQAALTGHLVFSTLHTNDAPSALTRLIDMGVKPFLVSAAVQAMIAQRLVRRLCKECSAEYHPEPEELATIGLDPATHAEARPAPAGRLPGVRELRLSRPGRRSSSSSRWTPPCAKRPSAAPASTRCADVRTPRAACDRSSSTERARSSGERRASPRCCA